MKIKIDVRKTFTECPNEEALFEHCSRRLSDPSYKMIMDWEHKPTAHVMRLAKLCPAKRFKEEIIRRLSNSRLTSSEIEIVLTACGFDYERVKYVQEVDLQEDDR